MTNSGIDYFPMDCHFDDDKMPIIEAEYGLEGFAVIVKLYQRIYGGCGYYCAWSDRTAMLFAKSCGVSPETVKGVVESALNEEIFDKAMYMTYGILTSHGVQKRFFAVAKRRRIVFDKPEYVLLSPEELNPANTVSSENKSCLQSASNCTQNVCNSETSKVKQSKAMQSEAKQSEEKQSNAMQSEEKQREAMQSEAKQSTPPAAAKTTEKNLIEKYGAAAVGEYEKRFRKWQNKQGQVHVDMYQTIEKWLEQDGVTKPLTSISQDDILRELQEQYSSPPEPDLTGAPDFL